MKLQKHRIAEVTFRNQNPELTYIIIQYLYVWIIRTLYIWLSRTLALPGLWFRHYVILNKTMNIVVLQMILFSLKSLHHCWGGSIPENSRDSRKNGFICTVWLYGFIFTVWLYGKISFYVYILHKIYLVEFTWIQFSYLARLFSCSSWDTRDLIDRNNCCLQCKLSHWGQ